MSGTFIQPSLSGGTKPYRFDYKHSVQSLSANLHEIQLPKALQRDEGAIGRELRNPLIPYKLKSIGKYGIFIIKAPEHDDFKNTAIGEFSSDELAELQKVSEQLPPGSAVAVTRKNDSMTFAYASTANRSGSSNLTSFNALTTAILKDFNIEKNTVTKITTKPTETEKTDTFTPSPKTSLPQKPKRDPFLPPTAKDTPATRLHSWFDHWLDYFAQWL